MRKCQYEGCDRDHNAHGWCKMHGQRFLKHGNPETVVFATPHGPDDPTCTSRYRGVCCCLTPEQATHHARESWFREAKCRGMDPAIFFPVTYKGETRANVERDNAPAKAICASCPVKGPCADFAIRTRQDQGVWGGLSELDRRRLRRTNKGAA